jgi:hypothetical protein
MTRRLVLLLALFTLFAATPRLRAQAQPSCDSLKAQRDKVKKALDKMEADKLPEDKLADLDNILGQIIDLLNSNSGDQDEIKKKIDELTKQLPPSDTGLLKSVNDFVKGISGGLGATGDAQKNAAEFLSNLRAKVNTIKDFYAAGDESRAGAQIDRFGDFFDDMTKVIPGVKQVPGLKDLFDAYSKGIHGIAKSATQIDAIVARNNQLYREAGFEGNLYLRGKTKREQRADQINALREKLNQLEGQIADGDCDHKDQPVDKCSDPKSRVVQDMRALHKKLDEERRQQQEEDDKNADFAYKQMGAWLAESKNMKISEAERAEARKSYETYKGEYYEAVRRRKQHTQEYEQKAGDLLDLVSKNEKWTPAEEQLLADCFPEAHALREQSRLRAKNTPPPDKTKDLPPKTTPTKPGTKTATNKPAKEPPKCQHGGGLAGAMEGVSNKIEGCK